MTGASRREMPAELRKDDTTQPTAQLIIQHCTVLLIAGIPIASETHGRLRARTYASTPYKMGFIPFLSKKLTGHIL